jgi:hypothetical protein
MAITVDKIPYGGWKNNVRVSNGELELVLTGEVGPRVIRLGFAGQRNLFAEMKGQMGGTNEKEWMIRGGHRLWIAPEAKPLTYELDNAPVQIRAIRNGVKTVQATGPLSGVQKTMEFTMAPRRNEVKVVHTLTNRSRKPVTLSPWALTVMAPHGMAIIPLPEKIPHTKRLTHNQEWSLWGYTDFTDGRWTIGSRYLFFRQDPKKGPNKLGVAHREGWVAYQLDQFLFVKCFAYLDGAKYPDGGVNFETFSNEEMLEVETLGPLVTLQPGRSVRHEELWSLYKGLKPVRTEADADKLVRKLS